MGLSMGFRASVSLRPAIQATGPLALAPVGLPPTEHVCLSGRTSLLPAALTANSSCGAVYATTSSERPAASSYLRSPPRAPAHHGPLDDGLHLAHVPGPVVAFEDRCPGAPDAQRPEREPRDRRGAPVAAGDRDRDLPHLPGAHDEHPAPRAGGARVHRAVRARGHPPPRGGG